MTATVSCDKIETETLNNQTDTGKKENVNNSDSLFYKGTLKANASSGDCITPDTKISINCTSRTDSVSLSIFKAKLANGMPAMDITIPGISLSREGNTIIMATDSSVPLAMGGQQFPRYTVTQMSGNIESDTIWFSLLFGSTPTSFGGKPIQ